MSFNAWTNAEYVEFHTGFFAKAFQEGDCSLELKKLKEAAIYAQSLGIKVNAGHGLNYENVKHMKEINGIYELNIGHSIISRAVFVGLEKAVSDMVDLIK